MLGAGPLGGRAEKRWVERMEGLIGTRPQLNVSMYVERVDMVGEVRGSVSP